MQGLKGNIYQRGRNSWRVQLSLGKNSLGQYEVKRETITGTKRDAIELLTRWNVNYLDNDLTVTNHKTVADAAREWLEFVKKYRQPNTYQFYKARFDYDILPDISHKKLKDVSVKLLQKIMDDHPTTSRHNKRALSAFYGWCVRRKIVKDNLCSELETVSKAKIKSEDDVWNLDQVRTVYSALTFHNLYDIFIVLGVECGLRPQEIMALTWEKLEDEYIIVDQAVKQRSCDSFLIQDTKTEESNRIVYKTPFLSDKLKLHQTNQDSRKEKNSGYAENNLVVADKVGNVPDLKYIRKYMYDLANKIGVPEVSPKDLRSTHISLLNSLGINLHTIQRQVGHAIGSPVTNEHYIRMYGSSLSAASQLLHDTLHK